MDNNEQRQFEIYEQFTKLDFSSLAIDSALENIGILVDLSEDLKKVEGLFFALGLAEQLKERNLDSVQSAILFYYMSNAWAGIRGLRRTSEGTMAWEQEELDKEILYLRKARRETGFNELHKVRRCQIITNLANSLNTQGRSAEAIEYWDMALQTIPIFGMASGNKGIALAYYARAHYDNRQIPLILKYAYKWLVHALTSQNIDEHAVAFIQREKAWIESVLNAGYLERELDLNDYSLGRSKAEKEYRTWCLKNRLFLNPLNDIGEYSVAAADTLCTPPIVANINEGPYFQGFFNQLKQEYVSARYTFFEGIKFNRPHFSDKDVTLINTLDYPAYSLGAERAKMAFRVAYSIFDKIAYYLNAYLRLEIPEKGVSFRTLWYEAQNGKIGFRKGFVESENWILRGLFSISRDLFEDKPDFKDCLEPDAQEINTIRNHLEHKYLKLHGDDWGGPPKEKDHLWLVDTLAASVYRRDFEEKTLRLLKLARSALIYLSLAIHHEEKRREKKRGPVLVLPAPHLGVWEDKWKI